MLFAPLACLLIASALRSRHCWTDLARVFSLHWTPVIILALFAYTLAGAIIMPRLFAGQTTVFIPSGGRIVETLLMPVWGNINQSGYFAAGALSYFSLSTILMRDKSFHSVKVAFFTFATLHAGLGLIDFAGKMLGLGDLLSPIRTAGYAMLVEVQSEGFWRIVGGFPEASAFGAASLLAIGFTFSYWRATSSRPAFLLSVLLLFLLLSSTSTTAYVGLAILSLMLVLSFFFRMIAGRFTSHDLIVLAGGIIALTILVGLETFNENALRPFVRVLESATVEKTASASAEERFYWNQKSWQNLLDTGGLGIGLGSSRASSWFFAVASQLGVVGLGLVGILLVQLLRPAYRGTDAPHDVELAAFCNIMRTTGIAAVLPTVISGGAADPGIVLFIVLATLLVGRAELADRHGAARQLGYEPASTNS